MAQRAWREEHRAERQAGSTVSLSFCAMLSAQCAMLTVGAYGKV
jgi:hypothetical protein